MSFFEALWFYLDRIYKTGEKKIIILLALNSLLLYLLVLAKRGGSPTATTANLAGKPSVQSFFLKFGNTS